MVIISILTSTIWFCDTSILYMNENMNEKIHGIGLDFEVRDIKRSYPKDFKG